MDDEQVRQRIRYLRDVEHLTFRQIGKELGIWRERCSRIYAGRSKMAEERISALEAYRTLIAEWYSLHPSLRATQIYSRLKQRGVSISYPSVARFTRSFRGPTKRCYWALNFGPGEEAQVDWFIVNHPILGKLAGFAFILSFSRFLFARIFPRLSFEFFIEGHLQAFHAAGGRPQALRYDNLRSVVTRRNPLTYNAAFLEFAHYYGFQIRLCNVRAGNEKGRVERAIRTIRETFLNTADGHQSLRALNCALAEWLTERSNTPHRTTKQPPAQLKAQEKLHPLPQAPWLNRIVHPPKKSDKTGMLVFDTNQYSIPHYLVGAPLILHAFCERIDIYDNRGKLVASHPRCFERNKQMLNPLHRSFTHHNQKTKRERIHTVIKNIDPAVKRFLIFNEAAGEDPYQTAHCIFQLLRNHSRAVLLSAIRDALARNAPRLAFVTSALTPSCSPVPEAVHPQNKQLLTIQFKPRSLKEYLP